MTFGYVVVPLFFSCVSGAVPSAAFKTTGDTTVLTFGLTAAAAKVKNQDTATATIPKDLIALAVTGTDPTAKVACATPADCEVTATVALSVQGPNSVLTFNFASTDSKEIASTKEFTVAVSGLALTPKDKTAVGALNPDKKTFTFASTENAIDIRTPTAVATFEFIPATTPAGEVCANTDGATKNTKACGCKAKNAKEEEQTYPCTADQVCDATATTAETACKATASNGSSLFLLAAFFLAMN